MNYLQRVINTENRHFRINVIGFLCVGALLLGFMLATHQANAVSLTLQTGGVIALFASSYGAVICFYAFKYNRLVFVRAVILGTLLFITMLFIGIATIGEAYPLVAELLGCLFFLMYFATLGTINAYFGIYISLFNVVVFVMSLATGNFNEPFIWVNVLDLMEIKHPAMQWGLIIISALLGAKEQIQKTLVSIYKNHFLAG